MKLERIAGVGCWIAVLCAGAAAQQTGQSSAQPPQAPAASVTDHVYPPATGLPPWRRLQTRSESGGREVVVETTERAGVDGRLEPALEVVSETLRQPGTAQTRTDVFGFGFGADRQRRLLETTQSDQEIASDGSTRTVQSTWLSDVNGHLALGSRRIEERRSPSPDSHESSTTVLLPGTDRALQESERTDYTERRISPAVVTHESTWLVRDLNGRWQPNERRSGENRTIGPSERVEEETVQRPDSCRGLRSSLPCLGGALVLSERTVTRRSEANGREQVVIETYAQNAEGFVRSDSRLALSRRVRRSTTAAADGSRNTVEEVEARSLVAPSDPMRVTQRTVTAVRRIGPDRWVTERQVFELDANGRMVPVITETEETTGK
jgi:hypothetical protein